ncbi:MAG: acyl-CoA carboxylase epsilon subunit [Candidatus Nanopelagicales bacterium]
MSEEPLRIRGAATPAEVAAVVAAIASLRAAIDPPRTRSRSLWSRPSRQIRPPQAPGPGAWRASALPRCGPRHHSAVSVPVGDT